MMKPNILFIATTPPPYHGVSVANQILLDSRLQDIFEIRLFDITDRRENVSNWGKLDLYNIWLAIKQIFLLIFHLLKTNYALIYLNFSQNRLAFLRDGIFILVCNLFSYAKIVGHLNGSEFKDFYLKNNFLYKWFIDICLYKIDTFIVVGECLKGIFEKWSSSTEVVPNGVDFLLNEGDFFSYKNKSYLRIVYLGNLFRTKGILSFIHVAKKLVEKYDYIHIDIAGARDDSDKLLNQQLDSVIRSYPERFKYHGVVTGTKKEELLKHADIFVFTPIAPEGLPFVILEAMAAQNPIITTNQGAIKEVVIENENGFVLASGDEDGIYNKLDYLILDKHERLEMGQASRNRYLTKYTSDIFVSRMIEVFNKVLAEN